MRPGHLAAVTFVVLCLAGCGNDTDTSSPTSPTATGGSAGTQPTCVPPTSPPDNLRVASVVGTTVELAWSPVQFATGYIVMVGTTPGGTDVVFQNTSQPSYRWGGVSTERKHYARVEAQTPCGNSPSTGSLGFTISG